MTGAKIPEEHAQAAHLFLDFMTAAGDEGDFDGIDDETLRAVLGGLNALARLSPRPDGSVDIELDPVIFGALALIARLVVYFAELCDSTLLEVVAELRAALGAG